MRANRVLRVRNRNDTSPANESDGRLNCRDAIGITGANDAPVSLAAERDSGEVGGSRRTGTRARTAGIAIDAIWIVRLPAPARPAADRFEGAEVRPFREIGFAKDHG